MSKIYRLLYKIISILPRKRIVFFKKEIILFENIRIFSAKKILKKVGTNINIGRKVVFGKEIEIGDESGIGCGCNIASYTKIGKNVMFGPECMTYTANHEFSRIDIPIQKQGKTKIKPIIIEEDVWIGARAIILPGVVIGKGSVIGAGCIVARNIPEYSVVVGNPGRVIKNRKRKYEGD